MRVKMPETGPAMRYCSRTRFAGEGKVMSRKDTLVLASRVLALLFAVWALAEASYLPEFLHSFRHYINLEPDSSTAIQYWRHYYLIRLSFLVTRMVGLSLMARWLYKGGPEVEELLLHTAPEECPVQN
jgi:hypothetical protein